MTDSSFLFIFFFNDTATTEIYTLSLHDALPISLSITVFMPGRSTLTATSRCTPLRSLITDRKSTRLNSSHSQISYAVFCLKKKKINDTQEQPTSIIKDPNLTHHNDIVS